MHSHKTILRAQKPVDANIKFVEPCTFSRFKGLNKNDIVILSRIGLHKLPNVLLRT